MKGFGMANSFMTAALWAVLPLSSCDVTRAPADRLSHTPTTGDAPRTPPGPPAHAPEERPEDTPGNPDARQPQTSRGLTFVAYRNLRGGDDGIALVDLDPESPGFGDIVQQLAIGPGALPHHIYFDRAQRRVYSTALGGSNLYEIVLDEHMHDTPHMMRIEAIDTHGNLVGEDMYFTEDGSRFYMTFMGGDGSATGGSVGVFDAESNQLLEVIEARIPDEPEPDEPFILYPHGISANEELGLLMVTSTIHADLTTGVGNTVTTIDMNSNEVLETYLVADGWDDLSSPVEVIMLRDELPRYALVTTMMGGDIWISGYDEHCERFGEFSKIVEGDDHGWSWALEFYIHEDHEGEAELYVSFALPGVVNVYALDELPALPLKRTLPAAAGAHHMAFLETASEREVIVVQNNLLNLDGLDAGTLMVVDIHTGEVLGTVDLAGEHGLMPESIEWAFGHGHDYHH